VFDVVAAHNVGKREESVLVLATIAVEMYEEERRVRPL
jgi:hypothetical protein